MRRYDKNKENNLTGKLTKYTQKHGDNCCQNGCNNQKVIVNVPVSINTIPTPTPTPTPEPREGDGIILPFASGDPKTLTIRKVGNIGLPANAMIVAFGNSGNVNMSNFTDMPISGTIRPTNREEMSICMSSDATLVNMKVTFISTEPSLQLVDTQRVTVQAILYKTSDIDIYSPLTDTNVVLAPLTPIPDGTIIPRDTIWTATKVFNTILNVLRGDRLLLVVYIRTINNGMSPGFSITGIVSASLTII